MEILAQPLCETVFTPSTFRHTKRLPIRISKPSHKKFHFKNVKQEIEVMIKENLYFVKHQQQTIKPSLPHGVQHG
jgi:hypothetical protein